VISVVIEDIQEDNMRLEAIDTPRGVVLRFSKDGEAQSLSIDHAEVRRMSIEEGIAFLAKKVIEKLPPGPTSAIEVYEVDDEVDVDISLFEEKVFIDGWEPTSECDVPTPREYLKEIGAL
jgi:hypothetical protein